MAETEDRRRTATSSLPKPLASPCSFCGSESARQRANEVVHHVEVAVGVTRRTGLLRSIEHCRTGLPCNGLRRFPILEGLDEYHLDVVGPHLPDHLREVRRRRREDRKSTRLNSSHVRISY